MKKDIRYSPKCKSFFVRRIWKGRSMHWMWFVNAAGTGAGKFIVDHQQENGPSGTDSRSWFAFGKAFSSFCPLKQRKHSGWKTVSTVAFRMLSYGVILIPQWIPVRHSHFLCEPTPTFGLFYPDSVFLIVMLLFHWHNSVRTAFESKLPDHGRCKRERK